MRFPQVLVIGPDGQQLGVMGRRAAIEKAYEFDLDLLCVAPTATPPVCKIVDYGKFHFQAQKKAKEAKKNQKIVELKEIQLTPQIGENDLQTKVKKGKEILTDGNKIKVGVRFRGRQLAHKEVGEEVIKKFISEVSELGAVEKEPILDGKWITAVIGPKIKK
ncbi:MAG: translation initiation factor IF-3 [Bacilli bacterium]